VDLYYMRARWYEPRTGRFLSEDPVGLEGGINPYAYAGNDPVNLSDPTGLELIEICSWEYVQITDPGLGVVAIKHCSFWGWLGAGGARRLVGHDGW
jgi:hypothetical protein